MWDRYIYSRLDVFNGVPTWIRLNCTSVFCQKYMQIKRILFEVCVQLLGFITNVFIRDIAEVWKQTL